MTREDTQTDEDDAHEDNYSNSETEDLSIKEQILFLISALKDSAIHELNYFKTRTAYSIAMIVKGSIFFLIAFVFVMIAFILLGVGLLLALKSVMGIIWATILSVVIFLSLSLTMAWIGKIYFKKLSFPELEDSNSIADDSDK